MTNDSHPASWRRQSVADEAAEWLATCSDPAASAADRAAFVDWLRRSNLHVEEFLRLSALMQRLSAADRSGRTGDLWPQDRIEDLVARALEQPQAVEHPASRQSAARIEARGDERLDVRGAGRDHRRNDRREYASGFAPRSSRRWAIAAAVVLVVGAAGALLLGPLSERGGLRYATAVGEIRSIVLPDGSVVELNTRSSLAARFSDSLRLVELDSGEAIFKVAKDRARPFRVVAGDTEIVAVGTQFNVYAARARTVVTVLEGRVRVTDRAASQFRAQGPPAEPAVELGMGEQAVIAPRQPIARHALADPARVTSWTERRLIFEEATLASVAEEFARYSPRVIRVDDALLARRQITGVFDASDPASLVQFLGAQGGVAIEQTEHGWTLRGTRL